MTKKYLLGIYAVSVIAAVGLVGLPVFADGPVNVNIVEEVDAGSGNFVPWQDIVNAMPGEIFSAIPRVQNDGEVPVQVRMCVFQSATDGSGNSINLPNNTFGIVIDSNWTLDVSEGDSNNPATGNCYKYNAELVVGERTEPLFREVTISGGLGNEYQNSTFNLHLTADAWGDMLETTPGVNNPDTGVFTNSEPLTTVGYVALSVGLIALLGMVALLVAKSVRKK